MKSQWDAPAVVYRALVHLFLIENFVQGQTRYRARCTVPDRRQCVFHRLCLQIDETIHKRLRDGGLLVKAARTSVVEIWRILTGELRVRGLPEEVRHDDGVFCTAKLVCCSFCFCAPRRAKLQARGQGRGQE